MIVYILKKVFSLKIISNETKNIVQSKKNLHVAEFLKSVEYLDVFIYMNYKSFYPNQTSYSFHFFISSLYLSF